MTVSTGADLFQVNISDGTDTVTHAIKDAVARADVSDLKSAFNDLVGSKYTIVNPENWCDPTALTDGILYANGTTEASTTYIYTGYIPVEEDDVIRQYYGASHLPAIYRVHVCAYDHNKTVLSAKGSDSTSLNSWTVPSGVKYIRMTVSKTYSDKLLITKNAVPTKYSTYFEPYAVLNEDFVTPETEEKIELLDTVGIEPVTVAGFNLVTPENSGVGIVYYSSGKITYDASVTSYKYTIVKLKKNTRYIVNMSCRYYIFTDDNDTVISSGSTSLGTRYFDSGNATKLYYTVTLSSYNLGLIIAEGYSGVVANCNKPAFLQGLNQRMCDSWFAVALPQGIIYFSVGIAEKLYFFNILALEKNIIYLGLGGTQEDDGVTVTPETATSESNTYGYAVYDDNLSVVAQAVRGMANRMTVCAVNVSNCSALIIGDSIIERSDGKIGQTMINAFAEHNKTLTLLGTRGTGDSKNEGRSGWSSADYVGQTERGRNEAAGQTVTNPFWNSTAEKFDFGYYMTNNSYASVDFVCIHLGGNDLYNIPLENAREKIAQTEDNICEMIDSILAWNPNQKIIISLAPTVSTNSAYVSKVAQKRLRAVFANFNAEMLVLMTKYGANVRCSNDYMIIDPATEVSDNIHPTSAGLEKIGMELFSQINCWQNT